MSYSFVLLIILRNFFFLRIIVICYVSILHPLSAVLDIRESRKELKYMYSNSQKVAKLLGNIGFQNTKTCAIVPLTIVGHS